MQTAIAFWPPLVFKLCPSSPRFQLRCLAHLFYVASEAMFITSFADFASTFMGQKAWKMPECLFFFISFCFPIHKTNFCPVFWQEFEAKMKLSGLTWRSFEGSKRVIGLLQAGRSTRYPATIETPGTSLLWWWNTDISPTFGQQVGQSPWFRHKMLHQMLYLYWAQKKNSSLKTMVIHCRQNK